MVSKQYKGRSVSKCLAHLTLPPPQILVLSWSWPDNPSFSYLFDTFKSIL